MTSARELFDQGQLAASIAELTREVKAKPGEVSSRIFLFELLCFAGDLERARKQLDVVSHQSIEIGVGIYREVLTAERMRRKVFDEGALPTFLTAPPEYAALHLEALSLQREKEPGKARALLGKSIEIRQAVSGQMDGSPFEEFEDSDLFIGPFLELFVHDRYVWLPFEEIRSIKVNKPKHLRDLIWIHASLEGRAGDMGDVLLPVLYPGTSSHPNESVKLGRITDWIDIGEGLTRGVGQRLFMIDGEERAMLEIGAINFTATGEQSTIQ